MATDRLTSEQRNSRSIVEALKASRGRMVITTLDGEYYLDADGKLFHDIGLAVQDFYRRSGKDFQRKGASV